MWVMREEIQRDKEIYSVSHRESRYYDQLEPRDTNPCQICYKTPISLGESYSYQVEAVSSQCSDADWSRQRAEGNLTGRYTDPRLHHTEQEAQCTLGDLGRVTRLITMRSDALEMMCFEICLRFESQGKNMHLFLLCRQQQHRPVLNTLYISQMCFSDVSALSLHFVVSDSTGSAQIICACALEFDL